jgi:hypothetical protein
LHRFVTDLEKQLPEYIKCSRRRLERKQWAEHKLFEWSAKLKNGLTSVDGAECLRHPSTARTDENVALVNELMHQNRHLTINDLAVQLGLSYEICQCILTEELNTKQIRVKFVSCVLNDDQKQKCVSVS